MKITKSTIESIHLSEIKNQDTITLMVDDVRKGSGSIVIEIFGKSWAYYWSHMGDHDLRSFFQSCDNQYLISKLAPQCDRVIDDDSAEALQDAAKKHIKEQRLGWSLTKHEARELWDMANDLCDGIQNQQSELYEIFGCEWWNYIPKQNNHEYDYMAKVINHIKEAFKSGA